MKLLTSVFPRNGRVLPAGGWFTLAVFAFLVGLEVAGRYYATSDIHDGLACFALIAAGLAVAVRHRREPLPWVNRLAALGGTRGRRGLRGARISDRVGRAAGRGAGAVSGRRGGRVACVPAARGRRRGAPVALFRG